jgi:PBP1b-binding outer membrane lipoprotein LpoB
MIVLLGLALMLSGCANATAPARDSAGPVVKDEVPTAEGARKIPIVKTYSP